MTKPYLSILPLLMHSTTNYLLDHLQRYDRTLQFYGKALSINPSSMKALNGKASISLNLKRNDEAFSGTKFVDLSNPDNGYLQSIWH